MHWNDEPKRNPFGGLDCDELLKTLDFVTATYVHRVRESPQITREFTPTAGFFNNIIFPRGRHWLWLCSNKVGTNFAWAPARIQLRHNGFIVQVLAREDMRPGVRFPQELCTDRADLDYLEIDAVFTRLGHPAKIAEEMLERLQGNSRRSFGTYDGFIDALLVLLFAVKAGRNCSTCSTSLMLLELMACQHPHADPSKKPFTLADAFQHDSQTDPMAMIQRELNILRHWLAMTELQDSYNQLSVKGRILKLMRTYLA